jgi:hypothetical protein
MLHRSILFALLLAVVMFLQVDAVGRQQAAAGSILCNFYIKFNLLF